jgi:hypothetical protein
MRPDFDEQKNQRTNPQKMNIRHSALPKLALCGQYQGAPGTSPAAERGTKLDEVFRKMWIAEIKASGLNDADDAAVRWALDECHKLGGIIDGLATQEALCKIKTPSMPHIGTADGVAVGGRWLVDLKSGQVYDYSAQMAAYALGLMVEHGADHWDTHLLFCDQRQRVTTRWRREVAAAVVRDVLHNVGKPPQLNDYCGWCAKSLTCPARVASKDAALITVENYTPTVQDEGFLALLNDPVRLGQFLTACTTLDDFREAAKTKARELLASNVPVPGWRLGKARVTETVEAEFVAQAVQSGSIGAINAIVAQGTMTAKTARKLWSDAGAVFPEEIVTRKETAQPLTASK